jgi:antitoxin CcdA
MRMESILQTAQAQTANKSARARHPAKRATNLSLSADVQDAAKSLHINVSQVCDLYLRDVVRHAQAHRWRQEHADFIVAYNTTLEAEGLPLDEWRTF